MIAKTNRFVWASPTFLRNPGLTGAMITVLLIGLLASPSPVSGSRAEQVSPEIAELKAIVDAEAMLVQRMQQLVPSEKLDKEVAHRIENIKTLYDDYLIKYPSNPFGGILYGKFLRKVNQPHEANEVFLDIHEDNPEIAVVHQHLALYASELGNYPEAFRFFRSAIALEPGAALFHYQFGEFLHTYSMSLIQHKLVGHSEVEELMTQAFAEASRLEPANRDFRLRWAESFFDVFRPDWPHALDLWDGLIASSTNRFELEVLRLQKARVLIELKRWEEARSLVLSVSDPSLQNDRRKLLAALP
jgi:tetratricopeptide (TPR) repeat protein